MKQFLMFFCLLVGLIMGAITIAIHAAGTIGWIEYFGAQRVRPGALSKRRAWLALIGSAAITMMMVHFVEMSLWALVYWKIVGGESFQTLEQSAYFSMVTFTSLGYGDVVIEGRWRLVSGIHAMVGLFVFGWTSALLFAVLQFILESRESVPKQLPSSSD